MNTTLTLTPVNNVDYENWKVINNSNIFQKEYFWTDEVQVFDVSKKKDETILISNISLYDDRVYIDGMQHHILHMLSR